MEQVIEAMKAGRANRAEKSPKWPRDAGVLSQKAKSLVRKARLKRQAEQDKGGKEAEGGIGGQVDGEETKERAVT